MSHRRAKFTVSRELLLQVLCLPADTQVLDARACQGPAAEDVLFVVEHPDLKELQPEEPVPQVWPMFKAEYDERSTILPKFDGWGANVTYRPPTDLSNMPAVCRCGWTGNAAQAVFPPAGLVRCPKCSQPVERKEMRPPEQRRPFYHTKG